MTRLLLAALAALAIGAPATAAASEPDAELFATNNTALITDPDDPRLDDDLKGFARTVERIIDRGGGEPRGSQLLDGVFFSSDLGGTTFERSRGFDVDRVDDRELREIADTVRRRFLQQSVLTFDHLPRRDREVDAILLEVPGVTAQALRDGLLADPEAQERLFGGSVTLGGRLRLVATLEDEQLARDFAEAIGGDLDRATTSYGEREFVEGESPVRIEDGALVIDGGEKVEIQPRGDILEIERGRETFEAKLSGFPDIRFNGTAGADTIRIGDLTDYPTNEIVLDLGAGDGRIDRVTVDTSYEDEQVFALDLGGPVGVLGPAFVRIEGAEPADHLTVNGNDGDDIVSASTAAMKMTLDGGRGVDLILGSPGDDVLIGGPDFDDVQGRRGNDVAYLGGDFDRFSWAPGDGSDKVDGGPSRDSLFFLGSADAEAFSLSPRGHQARLTRDVGNIVMDLDDVEEIDTIAGAGADTFRVGDMSRTPVTLVDVSLTPQIGAAGGDGQPDRVSVQGTDRRDRLTLTGSVVVGGTANLTGLPATVNISHAEVAHDVLAIDTGAGDDTVDTSAFDPDTIGLEID